MSRLAPFVILPELGHFCGGAILSPEWILTARSGKDVALLLRPAALDVRADWLARANWPRGIRAFISQDHAASLWRRWAPLLLAPRNQEDITWHGARRVRIAEAARTSSRF